MRLLAFAGDDPSTAWKTPYGEWRFIGNGGRTMPLFTAKELRGPWTIVGDVANLTSGECPSLFPLPALTPGTSAKPGQKLPTHVYKRGRMGGPTKLQDHFQLGERSTVHPCAESEFLTARELWPGDWVEGKPGEVAVWNPTPGLPFQARGGGVLVDPGLYCRRTNRSLSLAASGTDSAVLPDASKDFCTPIPSAADSAPSAIDTLC